MAVTEMRKIGKYIFDNTESIATEKINACICLFSVPSETQNGTSSEQPTSQIKPEQDTTTTPKQDSTTSNKLSNQDNTNTNTTKSCEQVNGLSVSNILNDAQEAERIFAQFKQRKRLLFKRNLIIEGSCNYFFWMDKIAKVRVRYSKPHKRPHYRLYFGVSRFGSRRIFDMIVA